MKTYFEVESKNMKNITTEKEVKELSPNKFIEPCFGQFKTALIGDYYNYFQN